MQLKGIKILVTGITDSGILRARSEIIHWILSEGAIVVVASPKNSAYVQLEKMGCRFVEFKLNPQGINPIEDFFAYKRYVKLLKEEKPDIVLTFTTKPNIYCTLACRFQGIKYITNVTGRGRVLGVPGIKQDIMVVLLKRSLKLASCLFFQNSNDRDFFEKKKIASPDIYRLIPGSGVNLMQFVPEPYPDKDSHEVHFLFISRILELKGIIQYVEAAREIRKTNPECVFHVLGDNTPIYKDMIENLHKEGVIVYHGRVNNVGDYIRNSHCTIMPSYYPEGMTNVVLESAASARPVITTNHPGCKEGVEDGVTGYIIAPRDTKELVKAIKKFISLSYEDKVAMGVAGRSKMEREFDRSIVTTAYKEEILKLL